MTEARKAGRVGTAFPPGFLVTAVLSLATAWSATGPFGLPFDRKATRRKAELRRSITEAVQLLAEAGKGNSRPDRRSDRLDWEQPG